MSNVRRTPIIQRRVPYMYGVDWLARREMTAHSIRYLSNHGLIRIEAKFVDPKSWSQRVATTFLLPASVMHYEMAQRRCRDIYGELCGPLVFSFHYPTDDEVDRYSSIPLR